MQNTAIAEAERLLGIADKLLQNRDLNGSREFAVLAQETEPLLDGSDQILAIVDVLLAAEKPLNNHRLDWYAILQVDRRTQDLEFMKKQYRRLALLLHPDKNRFSFSDHAFKFVSDAWAVLSDPIQKSLFDKELNMFNRVELSVPGWVQQDKLPVRRGGPAPGPSAPTQGFDSSTAADDNSRRNSPNFWTACPYCYLLFEYPKVYEGCCLRCQNCEKSFHGVAVQNLPPLVPGQDAYYCCWGFFPMGFVIGNLGSDGKEAAPPNALPNGTPPPETTPVSASVQHVQNRIGNVEPAAAKRVAKKATTTATAGVSAGIASGLGSTPRKRGRPRKNPLPT